MTQSSLRPITDIKGKLNVPEEVILEQMKSNIRRHLPQVQPHDIANDVAIIATGGPSLVDHIGDIQKQRNEDGYKLITVNGVHDFMLSMGIKPSAQVILDGREFSLNFVQNPIKECKYFLASQCHPSVFEALEGYDVYIFHADTETEDYKKVLNNYYKGKYYIVEGGTTVTLRTIMLFRMLGYKFFHMYGFDSCWVGDEHHSYPQEANDEDQKIKVFCDDREFYCAPWMMKQARDLLHLIRHRGNLFKLNVHGDGLIAHMLRTGSTITEEKKNGSRCMDFL